MVAVLGPRIEPSGLPIGLPADLAWSPSWSIRETASGVYSVNLDERSLLRSTARYRYVDNTHPSASNANTGLDPALPKKSIANAVNLFQNDTIVVKAGLYADGDSAVGAIPFTNESNVIAVTDFTTMQPGRVISTTGMLAGGGSLGAWSLVGGGTPNVYQATLAAAPAKVVDAAVAGYRYAPGELTNVGSIAAVEAAPGSWYWTAGVLYVRRAASTAPDANLRPLKAGVIHLRMASALSATFRGITFEGGLGRCVYLQNCATVSFIDCGFSHSQSLAGLSLSTSVGVQGVVADQLFTLNLIRCWAEANYNDGMEGTTIGAGLAQRWLLVDCEGLDNGREAGTQQGLSVHKAAGNGVVACVVVGGRYLANYGPQNIANVGGSVTACYGVTAHTLKAGGAGTGFHAGDASSMWLHGCTADVLGTDAAGGRIYTHSTVYRGVTGPGVVAGYVP